MNTRALKSLIAGFGLLLAGQATAQVLTVLHNFTSSTDGAASYGTLVLSGGTLYGTTSQGGSLGGGVAAYGTVFAISTNGGGFTVLHNFGYGYYYDASNNLIIVGSPDDGANPLCGLVLSGNKLYGATEHGGYFYFAGQTGGGGAVFVVNSDGSSGPNTTLYSFNGADVNSGGEPFYGSLALSGNTLYGATMQGGSFFSGTVFATTTNGLLYTNIFNFAAATPPGSVINSNGMSPASGLILSGNTLYGTTVLGGTNGAGTVFAITTNGANFTILHTFLYLNFHLTLSVSNGMGRWDCLPACRPEGSGADEFVTFWHWSLTKCAGSLNRSCLCPKLEPLIERPTKASSHLQE